MSIKKSIVALSISAAFAPAFAQALPAPVELDEPASQTADSPDAQTAPTDESLVLGGTGATAGAGGIAAGENANAGVNGIAIDMGATTNNKFDAPDIAGIAIGRYATANFDSIVLGSASTADMGGIAIGSSAMAANKSIAFGEFANAEQFAMAFGRMSSALTNGIAMGNAAHSDEYGVAFGTEAKASGHSSTAIGAQAQAAVENSVAIGTNAKVYAGFGSYSARATSLGGIAIGASAESYGDGIAIGQDAKGREGMIAIGAFAQARQIERYDPYTGLPITVTRGGIAFGERAESNGDGIAFGKNAAVLDSNADSARTGGVAIGTDSSATDDGVALGKGASAVAGSLALGQGAVATEAMTVSFGAAGFERRLTNVSSGVNRTDAVNFGQLQDAVTDLNNKITNINPGGPSPDMDEWLEKAKDYTDDKKQEAVTESNKYTDDEIAKLPKPGPNPEPNPDAGKDWQPEIDQSKEEAKTHTDKEIRKVTTEIKKVETTANTALDLAESAHTRIDGLERDFDNLKKDAFGGVAAAMAQSQAALSGMMVNGVGVGLGTYKGEHALAIGGGIMLNRQTVVTGSVSINHSETSGSLGVGFRFW